MSKVKRIILKGTKYEMGFKYGVTLETELRLSLDILKEFFVNKYQIQIDTLLSKTDAFYRRYPSAYQDFIKGIADGSTLTLDEVKILNGMETLNSLIVNRSEVSACAFISIPPFKTKSSTIIGRNYDFHEPFSKIAKYLTVTVLHEENMIPTAFIAMPGQIYCPSCINQKSLFVEFNNGSPSGGKAVNQNSESLLIKLLNTLQNSGSLSELDTKLKKLDSDYSLIVNVASKERVQSYEYSSYSGMKTFTPDEDSVYVSTNFYLNETWESITPSDENTWLGVSRRDNLLNLAQNVISVSDVMNMMDKKISDGGGMWNLTIYQMVYDTGANDLYLKRTLEDEKWEHISMNDMFLDVVFYHQEEL
ncbi:C45 family autoproteolytic acyltransferase/hydolase [Candidatus Fokinia crypta]|uniref:Uncharacterized protein n=1 Tax=Candidatus Fokinia crypta TaxID=1920990 RepID=A0ABZ0UNN3_9RICK|nr:C45 family autoproteolytic acyltransferase/hydolase [Candidatus Fokinia cryptica]WPX97731.1 hypothetical protein Fokcrypt_00246 [Candidatus Fokinia cryptica]